MTDHEASDGTPPATPATPVTPPPDDSESDVIHGRPPTAEESFYLETAWKEPVQGTVRIEETAKILAGAVATTSGVFIAAVKLSVADGEVLRLLWLLPLPLWWVSLLALIGVLMPVKYATGRDQPESWKQAFLAARDRKYFWLQLGAVFFIIGLATIVVPLLCL